MNAASTLPRIMRPALSIVLAAALIGVAMRANSITGVLAKQGGHTVTMVSSANGPGVGQNLNPLQGAGDLYSLMFSDLAVVGSHGHLRPEMLTQLPSVRNGGIKDGGRTVVLTLRRGLRWSSGAEITSRDVVFGWKVERLIDEYLGRSYYFPMIQSMNAVSRYVVVVRLVRPYAPVLANLPLPLPASWPRLARNPQAAYATLANIKFNYENSSYWTDGPYQVSHVDRAKRIIVLRRMPYYVVKAPPSISRIVYRYQLPSPNAGRAVVAAVRHKKTDIGIDLDDHDVRVLESSAAHSGLHLVPSFFTLMLEFNSSLDWSYPPVPNAVADVRVRQALDLAVNRIALIRATFGVSAATARTLVAYTPFLDNGQYREDGIRSVVRGVWDPIAKSFVRYSARSVRDAQLLLSQAGYGAGLTVGVYMGGAEDDAARQYSVLQKEWSSIGVQIERVTWKGGDVGQTIENTGGFQVGVIAKFTGPDPDQFRGDLVSEEPHYDYASVDDADVIRDFARGAGTFDTGERARWYDRLQMRIARHTYVAPLSYYPVVVATDRHVPNLALTPDDLFPAGHCVWEYAP